MLALAPPSSPMESVTGTGFTVPVRGINTYLTHRPKSFGTISRQPL